ncbi:hypothetical protein ACFE04_024417 [Oxalis oulophora]
MSSSKDQRDRVPDLSNNSPQCKRTTEGGQENYSPVEEHGQNFRSNQASVPLVESNRKCASLIPRKSCDLKGKKPLGAGVSKSDSCSKRKQPLNKDIHSRLEKHCIRLLEKAGWVSPVTSKKHEHPQYISPEGEMFKGLPKAWKAFGTKMLAKWQDSTFKADIKQWDNIGQFWSEVHETLEKIDQALAIGDLDQLLFQQWKLVDPFANLALDSRKLGLLRKKRKGDASQANASGAVVAEQIAQSANLPFGVSRKSQLNIPNIRSVVFVAAGVDCKRSRRLQKPMSLSEIEGKTHDCAVPMEKTRKSIKKSDQRTVAESRKVNMYLFFGIDRSVLSWLLIKGVIPQNEEIYYRNPRTHAVVKEGRVTQGGVICNCCCMTFSVDKFECHAEDKINGHGLNLFMKSGTTFNQCKIKAWEDEVKTRKSNNKKVEYDVDDPNDDSCGVCGDGGEVLCCDNCPAAFHSRCLTIKELPEGDWYCPHCTCSKCGDLVKDKDSSSPGFKCAQCDHKYHDACIKYGKISTEANSGKMMWCGKSCQQIYSNLTSLVGVVNNLKGGFSWMLLKCIHEEQIIPSKQALRAYCNTKLAVALTIMEESFSGMHDSQTGIEMLPQVMYNWGSVFPRLNYHGFYSILLEKDDVIISVANIRLHGTAVAEMPLIATAGKYRGQGMAWRLMTALEQMLVSMKVEMLVISAIPELESYWMKKHGFSHIEKDYQKNTNFMESFNSELCPAVGAVICERTRS